MLVHLSHSVVALFEAHDLIILSEIILFHVAQPLGLLRDAELFITSSLEGFSVLGGILSEEILNTIPEAAVVCRVERCQCGLHSVNLHFYLLLE